MSQLTALSLSSVNNLLSKLNTGLVVSIRNAAKKSQTCTRNAGNARAKHRGWKKQSGRLIKCGGEILATQRTTRWHPGLNVGMGRNGTLYAIHPGRVAVTCERAKLNWDHTWVQGNYAERQGTTFYKKYFNIITEPEHRIFKLIDTV